MRAVNAERHHDSREISLESAEKPVVTIDGFLTPAVAAQIVALTDKSGWSSSTVQDGANIQISQAGRSSATQFAGELGKPIAIRLQEIERKLQRRLGIDPRNLEPWQLTRYRRGERYDYHLDCGCWRNHPSGERRRTILLYLQAPARGGATHFRALNAKIRPLAGRLAIWNNLLPNGNCNYAMIHASWPVWQGQKIVLLTWERELHYVD